jgi:1-acyl-sn-glycerol-3-phosphate acyltransferase
MIASEIKELFGGNEYHTPDNNKRNLADKLFLGSRWYFMWRYAKIVLRTRKEAQKGIYDDEKWIESSYDIFKVGEDCGGIYHITGLQNLQNLKKPVVIISNHMSTLETMIFPGIIRPHTPLTFVIKKSLVDHYFVRDVMKSRKPIVVNRTNPREDFSLVIEKGLENLIDGKSVVIFPQTTRKTVFNASDFNTLGVKLAKKASVNVIPVAIKTDFWENGKGLLKDIGHINRKKPVYIHFGEPIEIKGNGKQENQEVINFIATNLEKWDKM